jgi:hypothetical protein
MMIDLGDGAIPVCGCAGLQEPSCTALYVWRLAHVVSKSIADSMVGPRTCMSASGYLSESRLPIG